MQLPKSDTIDTSVIEVASSVEGSSHLPDPEPYLTVQDVPERMPDGTTRMVKRKRWTAQGAASYLKACPRVVIQVPPDTITLGGDPTKSPPLPVTWQGARWMLPRGKMVNVPIPIAEIVQQSIEPLRTTQAVNRRQYIQDIGDSMGPEISL